MNRYSRISLSAHFGKSIKYYLTLIVFLMTGVSSPAAQAAPGDVDKTFGTNGHVSTDVLGFEDDANGVAVQPDGKIVVVGSASLGQAQADLINADFLVARYNANGEPDLTFGNGGKVLTDFSGDLDAAQAVAIQPNGKIIVAGYAHVFVNTVGFSYDFALVRYNADGSLDNSFGVGGKVLTNFAKPPSNINGDDFAYDLVLAPDGKIVVAGYSRQNSTYYFCVARYNSNGSLDTSFGSAGRALATYNIDENIAYAVALQPDGKIVIAGYVYTSPGYDFALVRFNSNGSVDTGFGNNGLVTTDFAFLVSFDFAYDLAVQADGKIVVAGKTDKGVSGALYCALARYNSDGSLDAGFGTGGKVTTSLTAPSSAHAVALQKDGKIIVAGSSGTSFESFDFAMARFNIDGSLDNSFGSGGKVTTDLFGDIDFANAIAIQPDGKVVLAGVTRPHPNNRLHPQNDFDIALVRYEAVSFDLCIQDDSSGSLLEINTATGAYQFSNCAGLTLGGTGTITRKGGSITLQQGAGNHRLLAKIDTTTKKATATIQILSTGQVYSITDRDITNNACACR
jgi:uncharacterized delta-60 repeat protein